jgi:UDP-N-acetyl-D-glucosamine dehydrogenase
MLAEFGVVLDRPRRLMLHHPEQVSVVGLGYVGLPLAVAFAEAGLRVVGVEKDPQKLAALDTYDSYVEDVPPERLRSLVDSGKLRFTEDYTALKEVEAVVICLPTPLNEHREPDLSMLASGARDVARNLRAGALVALESTTYPGTTREVVLPIIEEELKNDGTLPGDARRVGRDFYLAFAPERIDPGNRRYTITNIPKIVGGITPECTQRAADLYGTVIEEVHPVSSPESAEMAKLLENTFRGVNIALVNELALLCDRMDVDVWEVIEAAKSKPFGFMPFYPGPGLGGHCIPIDPFYLSWRARAFDMTTEFIELAGRVNVNMPYHAVGRIASALNGYKQPVNGSRVLLLGVSYKPNIGDVRESPSLAILRLLRQAGAKVVYHDPYISYISDRKLSSVDLTTDEIGRADCVVISTDHDIVDLQTVVESASLVVDLRNAVRRRLGRLPDNVEVL